MSKDDPNYLDALVDCCKRLERNSTSRILVVDDSSFFRKVVSSLLYIQQYEVLVAHDGQEALEILEKYPDVKVVLTDYNMPHMDGCRLAQEIRRTFKKDDLAIIGISSEGDKNMAARFIKSGANDFIIKQNFLVEEFYCRVNQCVENIDLIREARDAAVRDFLTGLHNRRYFFEKGREAFEESLHARKPLVCAMIDIDYFKQVNDRYGHDIGDLALQHVATLLRERVRKKDIVCRFGGEEFCMLMQGVQGKQALEFFEELRNRIESTPVAGKAVEGGLRITVSVGVSGIAAESLDGMIKSADELLYQAKEQGRNRVMWSSL